MTSAAPAGREIILVRHGRSAHVQRGWLDVDGLRGWMAAYDAAEIALHHPPPPALVALARAAGLLVASDMPRAVASARVLADGGDFRTSALLREAPLETPELPLPRLGGMRLPYRGWGLVLGALWLRAHLRGAPPPGVDAAALARADEAAAWVEELAAAHERVLVVTHATFRTLVGAALRRRGWRVPERRPFHEWSAWRYRGS